MRNLGVLLVAAVLAGGCGSAQKSSPSGMTLKEDRAAGANILTELATLEEELERQRALDAAVLAPDAFATAEKRLQAGRQVERRQGKISELRDQVVAARAALEQVRTRSEALRQPFAEALEARNDAIIAGAAGSEGFRQTEAALRELSSGTDIGDVDHSELATEVAGIRDRFRSIEITAIKDRYLSDAYSLIQIARERGSDELLPGSYEGAVSAIRGAERYIEHNPYDASENAKRAAEAAFEARRVLALSDRALWIRQQPVEEVVLWMESRANELRRGLGLGDLRDRNLGEQFDVVAAGVNSMDFTNQQLSIQNEEMRSELGRQGEAPQQGEIPQDETQ